jgi:hypothetical protein
VSDLIKLTLHSGRLSGVESLDCEWDGHAEVVAYVFTRGDGKRATFAKTNLFCDDAASLRALAAICTQAADALDAPKIVTQHVYPPIPTRNSDWQATLDGYEPGDLIGEGATEAAAIADLKSQISEAAE